MAPARSRWCLEVSCLDGVYRRHRHCERRGAQREAGTSRVWRCFWRAGAHRPRGGAFGRAGAMLPQHPQCGRRLLASVPRQHDWRTPKIFFWSAGATLPQVPGRGPRRDGRSPTAHRAYLNQVACEQALLAAPAWLAHSKNILLECASHAPAGARQGARDLTVVCRHRQVDIVPAVGWRAPKNSGRHAPAAELLACGSHAPAGARQGARDLAVVCRHHQVEIGPAVGWRAQGARRASMAGALQKALWSAGAMLPRRPSAFGVREPCSRSAGAAGTSHTSVPACMSRGSIRAGWRAPRAAPAWLAHAKNHFGVREPCSRSAGAAGTSHTSVPACMSRGSIRAGWRAPRAAPAWLAHSKKTLWSAGATLPQAPGRAPGTLRLCVGTIRLT